MMAQSQAESTWDIHNYGKYINQFPPNTIKAIRQYERINKKICRQKCQLFSTKFVIMKKYYQYIYIYIYIYIYMGGGHKQSPSSKSLAIVCRLNSREIFFQTILSLTIFFKYIQN